MGPDLAGVSGEEDLGLAQAPLLPLLAPALPPEQLGTVFPEHLQVEVEVGGGEGRWRQGCHQKIWIYPFFANFTKFCQVLQIF